ncbi:MAG: hydroxyacid dehydrogenase [Kiritimatiellia bacterium]|jgi:phosphoglycerate dehydrogenase-like enzyme
MSKKIAALVLDKGSAQRIYGPEQLAAIRELAELRDGVLTREALAEAPALLEGVQLMFSGWGAPLLDAKLLAAAPRLEAVFYGAGSIRYMLTPEFWARGIVITSSWQANAVPVAEFVEALVILSLKRFWESSRGCTSPAGFRHPKAIGAYGASVGLVSLGMVGKMTAERLHRHDLKLFAYDPFFSQEKADALGFGITMLPLDTLFATCDIVSLHAPNLPTTQKMITGALLASMKPGATFINTARGAVVDEIAMIETLRSRPDLLALLDVTNPEPPAEGSPLYTLPNVVLSPHIAGSMGDECKRMGDLAVEQCRQYLAGQTPQWRITREMAETLA